MAKKKNPTRTISKAASKKSSSNTVNPDIKKLAKRIKELRIKKGYTNYEYFAYDNNIARAQYGKYETGKDIRFTSLLKVIKAFGMTPKEFFSEGFD